MVIQIFILLAGFIILIKGADIFVDGASSSAVHFNVSKILIGLTIVAFGTSAPEFAVSIKSISLGDFLDLFKRIWTDSIISFDSASSHDFSSM